MNDMTQHKSMPDAGQPKSHRARDWTLGITGAVALVVLGVAIGMAGNTHTVTRTVTRTVTVPGPATTVTVTAPPPAAGTAVGKWSGTGNQNTPAFSAPASGNYIVTWTYSGNVDPAIGQGTNFAITLTDQSATALGLPNDIAASGSGSTEVTGASGVESFNVEAAGNWTIKVVTAP
jgi:hypothetical protein